MLPFETTVAVGSSQSFAGIDRRLSLKTEGTTEGRALRLEALRPSGQTFTPRPWRDRATTRSLRREPSRPGLYVPAASPPLFARKARAIAPGLGEKQMRVLSRFWCVYFLHLTERIFLSCRSFYRLPPPTDTRDLKVVGDTQCDCCGPCS